MKRYIVPAVAALLLAGCASTGEPSQSSVVDAPSSSSSAAPAKKKADPLAGATKAQRNAVGAAQDYLETSGFSKKGLIKQLSSSYGDGYKKKDAVWAVDHIKVNWKKQAVRTARDYLNTDHFSRKGLIDQLSSPYGDQYTRAEATYAANKVGL